jgi:hypothetical protein
VWARAAVLGPAPTIWAADTMQAMAFADTFQEIVDSLPDDWTDLELDVRIFDETRYVDGCALTVLR